MKEKTHQPPTGLPWHWLFAVLALGSGAYGAWTQFGPMPLAKPLPTTGGTSGEIIHLQEVVDAGVPQSLQHKQVQLVGRLRAEYTVLLEGRDMAGRKGYYVLTPLVERGNTGMAVLVQRGWLPSSTPDVVQKVRKFTPLHDLVIHGRLAVPDLGAADNEVGAIRKKVNLEAYAKEIGIPMVPMLVLEEPETTYSTSDLRNGMFKQRWPELYPQDRNIARNAWAALVLAALLVGVALWLWTRRASAAKRTEPDWDSTL